MTDAGGDELEGAEREAADAAEAVAASDAAAREDPPEAVDPTDDTPSSAEYSIAFTPRNLAVGLAIVAGLVALVARRRRRARSRTEDD